MKNIVIFDPSLKTNNSIPSINLGDLIIWEAIDDNLKKIFQHRKFRRISSHTIPEQKYLNEANLSKYTFFGGTNILSSNLKNYNQWKLAIPNRLLWLFKFPCRDVILLGVGWWQYEDCITTSYTKAFYKNAFSNQFIHSVRDNYTRNKLNKIGIENVVNTGCPTMWMLNNHDVSSRVGLLENCIFTLTDYHKNPKFDNQLIKIIIDSYSKNIFFFPQGSMDLEYLITLSNYQKYISRITIVKRNINDYISILASRNIDYIGTRLHAGIKALQMKKNTLILSIDNRAREISNDTGLPVVERNNFRKINNWIKGEKLFDKIQIPVKEIEIWKSQFRKERT
jgi:Polysaccharide pyruvyl transferase